jgi:hypothetical protein
MKAAQTKHDSQWNECQMDSPLYEDCQHRNWSPGQKQSVSVGLDSMDDSVWLQDQQLSCQQAGIAFIC